MLEILAPVILWLGRAAADIASDKEEPPATIPFEGFAIITVLLLMMFVSLVLYFKFRPQSKKGIFAESATLPVLLPASSSEVIVKVDFQKPISTTIGSAAKVMPSPDGYQIMQDPDQNQAKPSPAEPNQGKDTKQTETDANQASAATPPDQTDSRKSSDPADRSFRKFRLHSLSDADAGLLDLAPHDDEILRT